MQCSTCFLPFTTRTGVTRRVNREVPAEGGLHGRRWTTVGLALGHLHRRLARHPSATPAKHNGATVCDLTRARHRYEQLIAAYSRTPHLGAFEQWALEAARERQALLPRVAALLGGLPALTVQIVHGDLAAPNLLLRQTQVAAFIDFQPPVPRHLFWEIARIGCDLRTVVRGPEWLDGLVRLTAAYRQEHPAARAEDLIHTVTVGCLYTLAGVPVTHTLEKHDRHLASARAVHRYPAQGHRVRLSVCHR
ncbi:phosphotransferase [Streptomyces chrestomyceticus]|uniref:phosphotransferase n=1 Tax=Streptomyces chrestomyceticus TaxID=68185 RepID=UPI0033C168FE